MGMKKIFLAALLSLVLLAATPPLTVSAAVADDIADKLFCQCGGCSLVITECDHEGCPSAEPMHDLVKEMVAEGQSEEQITQYFVAQYGEKVLASPKQESPSNQDSSQVAGVFPFIAVLLAGVIVYFVLNKWVGRSGAKR